MFRRPDAIVLYSRIERPGECLGKRYKGNDIHFIRSSRRLVVVPDRGNDAVRQPYVFGKPCPGFRVGAAKDRVFLLEHSVRGIDRQE